MCVTFTFHHSFPAWIFAFFLLLSGLGCHYLHLHKGECQTDQYLEKCRVYKPLKNGVSLISWHVILLKRKFSFTHFSYLNFNIHIDLDKFCEAGICAQLYISVHLIMDLCNFHSFHFFLPLLLQSECWKKQNDRRSSEEDWSGEIFGFDSRCFFSSLNRQVCVCVYLNISVFSCSKYENTSPLFCICNTTAVFLPSSLFQSHFLLSSSSVEGRCYRHRCTGPNRYQIQVSGSEWVDCPAGGTIQVTADILYIF